MSQAVALEMAAMLRDCAGWKKAAEYIDVLPASIRDLDSMQEQRNLALSKTGEHLKAIAALEELVRRSGDNSESARDCSTAATRSSPARRTRVATTRPAENT